MQSLNFLRQTPTVNWFDFFVNRNSLIEHLQQKNPEPSSFELISEFCERAIEAETRASLSDILPNDREYLLSKSQFLWQLAMATATAKNWDLEAIFDKCPLVFVAPLFNRLLCFTSGDDISVTPEILLARIASTDFCDVTELTRFGVILYCRWCVTVFTRDKYAKPKPRATVSNPNSQTDPAITANEDRKTVAAELAPFASLAAGILKNWVDKPDFAEIIIELPKANSLLQSKPPDPDSIIVPRIENGQIEMMDQVDIKPKFDPLFIEKIYSKDILAKVLFDLGNFEFDARNYSVAKSIFQRLFKLNDLCCIWPIDEPRLIGYFMAMGFDTKTQPKVAMVRFHLHNANISDQVQDALSSPDSSNKIPLVEAERAGWNNVATGLYIKCARVCNLLYQNRHVPLALIDYCVSHPGGKQLLCKTLVTQLNKCSSANEMQNMATNLGRICRRINGFQQALNSHGVSTILGPFVILLDAKPGATLNLTKDLNQAAKVYTMENDDMWSLTTSFDPANLRGTLENIIRYDRRLQMSMRLSIPPSLENVVSRMNYGFPQDLVVLLAGKIDQLWAIGETHLLPALITAIVTEVGPNLASDRSLQATLNYEVLRIELERWHWLSYRLSNVNRVGKMTMKLEEQVKDVILQGSHTLLQAHITQLALAFLINTANWQFLVTAKDLIESKDRNSPSHRVNTYLNLCRIMAGYGFARGKQQGAPNDIAHVMFNTLLPTMEDQKRGAPANIYIQRNDFIAIVHYIKEHTAISLLLAYFGRLFNLIYAGTAKIVYEDISWPATYTDASSINNEFLLEILKVTIENAITMTPSNAFFLRAKAEVLFVEENYADAVRYYLQTLIACSESFDTHFPTNVTDDMFFRNMVKCCAKLGCHYEETLLSQLVEDNTIYVQASKAIQKSVALDANNALLQYIWDHALFEYIIASLEQSENERGVLMALNYMQNQELNVHNNPAVLQNAVHYRKNTIFMNLCANHFS